MRDLDILFAQNWVEQYREDFWKCNKKLVVTRTRYETYSLRELIMYGLGWAATPEREYLWSDRYSETYYLKPFYR